MIAGINGSMQIWPVTEGFYYFIDSFSGNAGNQYLKSLPLLLKSLQNQIEVLFQM